MTSTPQNGAASTTRGARAGCKIGYSSHLISSEEAPEKERTLRKQRLRWAQGWFEISLKHILALMVSPYTSVRQKIGFFTLLSFREFFVYVTFHPLILLAVHQLRSDNLTLEIFFVAAGAAIFSVGTIRVCAAYALSQGEVRHSAGVFVLYALVQLFWTCYLNVIQVRPAPPPQAHAHPLCHRAARAKAERVPHACRSSRTGSTLSARTRGFPRFARAQAR